MSVVVLGYHQMGFTGLDVLLRRGVEVSALFTYEDDPNENCWFDSVAERARGAGVPVYTTESINDPEWVARIEQLSPDLIFSFYYRHIVRRPIRRIPRFGAYNLHGSLLPRYRGRSPLNWQLVNGEIESGVTLHEMLAAADAGDIVGQERVTVGPDDTALQLYKRLNKAAVVLLERHLDDLLAGRADKHPQDHSAATVFGGRRPADGAIDWRWPSKRVHDLVRAVAPPWPGAFGELSDGRLAVLATARTEPGALGPLAPGQIARFGERLLVGTGDDPIELLSWHTPGERTLGDDEQLVVPEQPMVQRESSP